MDEDTIKKSDGGETPQSLGDSPPSEEKKDDSSLMQIIEKGEQLKAELNALKEENIKILKQQQELAARNLLGGGTNITPEDTKKETPKEYAKRIMGGTV